MVQLIKPITVALKGKGFTAFLKRINTISRHYGLNAGKMDRALNQLSQLLYEFDCRATLPITTVALARNEAVVQKYQARGIEFAVHGYRHVDYSQLSSAEQTTHLRKACKIFADQGVNFSGFRSPYLRWNESTLAALSKTSFGYDSSNSLVWEVAERCQTESYRRAIKFYGALPASKYPAIPCLDFERDLVRIPYCLPDDESLIERLVWQSPAEMDAIWPDMFRQIHDQGELFNLGLHPERTNECFNGLRATMESIQSVASEVWRAQLREIAAWWKARFEAKLVIDELENNILQISIVEPAGATLLLRSVTPKTATTSWFDGYQQAAELPCLVQTDKRPFIGVSPDSDPSLISFLKQQGYIIEPTIEPESYTIYFDRRNFNKEQQRSLISEIETSTAPLVRLGRWPDGARSAFCVTGDIDALTMWDYGLRFLGS